MISWDVAQFTWERYTGKLTELQDMNREEVVAMLKRHSTGFSRCPHIRNLHTPFARRGIVLRVAWQHVKKLAKAYSLLQPRPLWQVPSMCSDAQAHAGWLALQGPVQVQGRDAAPPAGALGGQNWQGQGQALHVFGHI